MKKFTLLLCLFFMPLCLSCENIDADVDDDEISSKAKAANQACTFDPVPETILAGNDYRATFNGVSLNQPGVKFYTAVVDLAGSTKTAESKIPTKGTMFVSLQPWATGSGVIRVMENKVDNKKGTTVTKEKARCSFTVTKSACVPTTCAKSGAQCGQIDNGCGAKISCDSCGDPSQVCTDNQCCTPRTCASEGKACGTLDTGCGQTIKCNGCEPGSKCNEKDECVACVPQTCAPGSCGQMSDGCGNTIDCGICEGCTPRVCVSGVDCSMVSDGCGGTLNCSICSSGWTCEKDKKCAELVNQTNCPYTGLCPVCGWKGDCTPQPIGAPNRILKWRTDKDMTCQETHDSGMAYAYQAGACGIIQAWAQRESPVGCDCPEDNRPVKTTKACPVCPGGVVDQGKTWHYFTIGALNCQELYKYAYQGFVPESLCSKTKAEALKFGCCASF